MKKKGRNRERGEIFPCFFVFFKGEEGLVGCSSGEKNNFFKKTDKKFRFFACYDLTEGAGIGYNNKVSVHALSAFDAYALAVSA